MSDYIPEEIMNKILLQLPVKSLLRFRVVCRSWNTLITSSTFIDAHLHRTEHPNTASLLLLHGRANQGHSVFYSLHWDNPEMSEYTNLENPPIYSYAADLVGTHNGLVCLIDAYNIVLWNPCIRKFVFSPIPPMPFLRNDSPESFAFGFESHNRDYKVLLLTHSLVNDHQIVPIGKVWSLSSRTWTSLSAESLEGVDACDPFLDGVAHVNNALHWLRGVSTELEDGEDDFSVSMVSFNLVTETFRIQERVMKGNDETCFRIARYRETLALFQFGTEEDEEKLEMWIMKDFDEPSWSKFLGIRHLFPLEPFGFKTDYELVVGVEDQCGRVVLKTMNMKNEQVRHFGRVGVEYIFLDSFTESLVFLNYFYPNVISY